MSNISGRILSAGSGQTSIRFSSGSRTYVRPETSAIGNDNKRIVMRIQQGSTVERAESADTLSVPRKIVLTGAVEGEGVFDGSGDITIFTAGEIERDYKWIRNKPKVNNVELEGNKTLEELGIQPAGEFDNMTYEEVDMAIDRDPMHPADMGVDPMTDNDIDAAIDGDEGYHEDEDALSHDDIDQIFNDAG